MMFWCGLGVDDICSDLLPSDPEPLQPAELRIM